MHATRCKNFNQVHLVKGPAEVTLKGSCQVLGKDISNRKVSVSEGKILPFEIYYGCKIDINFGKGGKIWVADYSEAGTRIWRGIIQKVFFEKKVPKLLLIIGESDTGKSTLTTYILNVAIKNGYRSAIVDADIGQGDLGPPNSIGSAVVTDQITDLREINAQFFEFIGNTSPLGFEDIIIRAIKNSLKKISASYDLCIINTDGYILSRGLDYKIKMARELQPDLVVCLGERSYDLFDKFKSRFTSSVVLCGRSSSETIKSRIERNKRRLNQLLHYIRAHDKNKIITRELKRTKFVYKGIAYSRICRDQYGFLKLRKRRGRTSIRVKLSKLVDMFVGLSINENIIGFGIIVDVSLTKISIKSNVDNFDKIHLSNSGISKDNTMEFRIIN